LSWRCGLSARAAAGKAMAGVGTVVPPPRPSGSGVLVRWDDGSIGTHDPAELLADD
jgi:hypothetical protein